MASATQVRTPAVSSGLLYGTMSSAPHEVSPGIFPDVRFTESTSPSRQTPGLTETPRSFSFHSDSQTGKPRPRKGSDLLQALWEPGQ